VSWQNVCKSNLLDRSSPEIGDEEAKQDEKGREAINVLDMIDAMALEYIIHHCRAQTLLGACLRVGLH
jgi:hypothetical protein